MLKLIYYGQNDGAVVPGNPQSPTNKLTLTGDPGVDNATLATAGFQGGIVVAISGEDADGHSLVIPCDASNGNVPYGFLLNGPGENSGSLGPSGSGKTPVVRAMPKFYVDSTVYDSNKTYTAGAALYCGGSESTSSGAGKIIPAAAVANSSKTAYAAAIGTCTHKPTASAPWLGVASLL